MINKTITLELQLTEEQVTELFDAYTYIDVNANGIYENFDKLLHDMMDFGALKHIRENIEFGRLYATQYFYCKQT